MAGGTLGAAICDTSGGTLGMDAAAAIRELRRRSVSSSLTPRFWCSPARQRERESCRQHAVAARGGGDGPTGGSSLAR